MRKICITPVVVFLFVLFGQLIVKLQAQNLPKTCRVYCPDGSSHLVDCNTTTDPCTGGTLDPNRVKGGKMSNSPLSYYFAGGLLGALGGSLQSINGKNQWFTGALMGSGGLGAVSLFATTKKRSLGENIVIGVVTGATGGASVGMYQKANADVTSTKPDNTLKYAAIGAVVVASISAALPNEGKSKSHKSSSYFRKGKPGFLAKISVGFSGNGIGIVVKL